MTAKTPALRSRHSSAFSTWTLDAIVLISVRVRELQVRKMIDVTVTFGGIQYHGCRPVLWKGKRVGSLLGDGDRFVAIDEFGAACSL